MIEAIYILIAGIIILGFGYFGNLKSNAKIAYLVGGLMVLGGAFYPGYGVWEDMYVDTTPDAAIISGVTFDITPTNGSYTGFSTGVLTVTVDEDSMGVTAQVAVDSSDCFTAGNATSINFSINPVAPLGATATDLATIHFSVDETQEYAGEHIYTETSDVYEAQFAVDGYDDIVDYEGSHTMLLTETAWVEFQCDLDGAGTGTFGEEFDAVGDRLTIPITFWTDGGFRETYTITLICISAA